MPAEPRRRQRRKDARPSEIVEAAIEIFGERGFGAARLEDVARRAGVSKGTVFVYFPTKADLFRAVAQTVLTLHLERLGSAAADLDGPLTELVPLLLAQAAAVIGEGRLPAMMRLLIAEARKFPDLARVWHDEVVSKVLGLVTAVIERAQVRGEVRPGNARLYAFSIVGPMLASALFREVFRDTALLPDLAELATQHAQTVLHGMLLTDEP
ncbi:MAG: TetR/AcrR family transcriptional regulator [Croceibacterium sp.]